MEVWCDMSEEFFIEWLVARAESPQGTVALRGGSETLFGDLGLDFTEFHFIFMSFHLILNSTELYT